MSATTDPAGVSVDPPRPRRSKKDRRSLRRRASTQAAEKAEDVSDAASFFDRTIDGLTQSHAKLPDPPGITQSGTRTPSSPPIASPAAHAGVEAPTLASAAIAVGVVLTEGRSVISRIGRGFRLPEQHVEDPTPPRRLHLWEEDSATPPSHTTDGDSGGSRWVQVDYSPREPS